MNKWVKRGGHGALWLLAATLITKLIGVMQKIPLQNIGGDAVFGIYNMVYPIYQLLLILAVSGIPTAVSAIIAQSHDDDKKTILRASSLLMLVLGLVFGYIVYSNASYIAYILGSSALTDIIKIMSITICITPILASYRGYYQGVKLASYSSLSQLIEQIIRVSIMVIILYIGVQQQWTDIALTTYVMWGGVVGAAIALMYLMSVKQAQIAYTVAYSVKKQRRPYSHYICLLLTRGVPAALAAIIVPLVAVVDSLSIPQLLKPIASFTEIAQQFGIYSRIQPLVQLVTMLLAAVVAGVLPDLILHNKDKYKVDLIERRISIILGYTIIIGAASTIGLLILAEPITVMLYKNSLGVGWFKLLAFMTFPAAILAVITPFLLIQGRIVLLALMIGLSLITKIGFNILLVSHFESMLGAIHATNIALYVTAGMALIVVCKSTQKLFLTNGLMKTIGRCLLSLLAMMTCLVGARYIAEQLLSINMDSRAFIAIYVIVLVATGATVLAVLLFKLAVITKEQIKLIISNE